LRKALAGQGRAWTPGHRRSPGICSAPSIHLAACMQRRLAT
jgi:hypothetical protein